MAIRHSPAELYSSHDMEAEATMDIDFARTDDARIEIVGSVVQQGPA